MVPIISVFNGANATSGPVVLTVPGVKAGDKVSQVMTIAPFAHVGDQTAGFEPFAPADGCLVQNSGGQDWSTWTFVVILIRANP